MAVTRGARRLVADSAALRRFAAEQKNPRLAKRLRVIAHLADGLSTLDAAARERVNESSARKWREAYQWGGVQALLRMPAGRRAWLNAAQSTALAALIRQQPKISYVELCAFVKRKFGIIYREKSLAAYIARHLGFMRHEGRFFGGRDA